MEKKYTKDEIREILESRFASSDFRSIKDIPAIDTLLGAIEGGELVASHIRKNNEILIVGDYDVDGVCATAIVIEFFNAIGFKSFAHKIPNRFKDGYGIKIDTIKESKASLIITVDNGINANEVGEYCTKNGIDLLITDHHTPKEILPEAKVIIDPKQKNCNFPQEEICGASVAWYLCASIKKALAIEMDMGRFCDLIALATIADMMPLLDVNRVLVKRGLAEINSADKPYLKILKSHLKKSKIDSQDISYTIAPILNSAGRMSDANIALEFILAKDLDSASRIFQELIRTNLDRKKTGKEIYELARSEAKKNGTCIIAQNDNWHEGVLGIVAVKLAQEHNLPAFVFTSKDGILCGSGRSVSGENIIETLKNIDKNSDILIEFGGHKNAAGVKLRRENLNRLLEALKENSFQRDDILKDANLLFLDSNSIDMELLEILESFEPYGKDNEPLKFCSENLYVLGQRELGATKNHRLLRLKRDDGGEVKAIIFSHTTNYSIGENLRICFELKRDEYTKNVSMNCKKIIKLDSNIKSSADSN